jgi:hypothetical protein
MHHAPSSFQGVSIRTRLVIYYVTFALLTLIAVVYLSYRQAVRSIQMTMEDKLAVIADLQTKNLDHWVDEQQRNALFLASLPELRSYSGILMDVDSTEDEKENARQKLTLLLAIIVQRTADFHDIQILDLQGDIAISMIAGNKGLSQADQSFFTEGMSRTYSQPFYESPLLNGPAMTVSTPLFDTSQKRVGVLVLHFNLKRVDAIFHEGRKLNESVQSYLIGHGDQVFLTGDPHSPRPGRWAPLPGHRLGIKRPGGTCLLYQSQRYTCDGELCLDAKIQRRAGHRDG